MKYIITSFCFVSVLVLVTGAAAQNGTYSSFYDYTVTYNPDGSANVTPTAEVSGIDDVSDWVEGSYRPLCSVGPKIQVPGDANWVAGTRVALGRAVNQVRTGQAQHIPRDGSEVNVNLAVEVDAFCSGAPNPNYYLYPGIANLYTWSAMDPAFWYLAGFAPAQTGPPYWYQYCSSGDVCPVSYGVASIKNFVDFADFLAVKISLFANNYAYYDVYQRHVLLQIKLPKREPACQLPVARSRNNQGTLPVPILNWRRNFREEFSRI
jgi:hypothetical protein